MSVCLYCVCRGVYRPHLCVCVCECLCVREQVVDIHKGNVNSSKMTLVSKDVGKEIWPRLVTKDMCAPLIFRTVISECAWAVFCPILSSFMAVMKSYQIIHSKGLVSLPITAKMLTDNIFLFAADKATSQLPYVNNIKLCWYGRLHIKGKSGCVRFQESTPYACLSNFQYSLMLVLPHARLPTCSSSHLSKQFPGNPISGWK